MGSTSSLLACSPCIFPFFSVWIWDTDLYLSCLCFHVLFGAQGSSQSLLGGYPLPLQSSRYMTPASVSFYPRCFPGFVRIFLISRTFMSHILICSMLFTCHLLALYLFTSPSGHVTAFPPPTHPLIVPSHRPLALHHLEFLRQLSHSLICFCFCFSSDPVALEPQSQVLS